MKKTIAIMVMMFLAAMTIQAQDKPATPHDSIVFAATTHDYGTIVQASDGSCVFCFHE